MLYTKDFSMCYYVGLSQIGSQIMANTQLLYRGKIRQRIKFNEFTVDDACVKLNLINILINTFNSTKFVTFS